MSWSMLFIANRMSNMSQNERVYESSRCWSNLEPSWVMEASKCGHEHTDMISLWPGMMDIDPNSLPHLFHLLPTPLNLDREAGNLSTAFFFVGVSAFLRRQNWYPLPLFIHLKPCSYLIPCEFCESPMARRVQPVYTPLVILWILVCGADEAQGTPH